MKPVKIILIIIGVCLTIFPWIWYGMGFAEDLAKA